MPKKLPWLRSPTGYQAEADDELERLYPCSHGGVGGDRLLHGGSAYAKRVDYVLRAVFHSFGEPEDMLGRSHTSSESRVDGTDGARCDDGRFWFLIHRRYLLHDHDSKYSSSFRQVIEAGSVKTLALPPRSPNLNAYAERWVRSVREECLAKLILLGEGSLRRAAPLLSPLS